MYFSVTQFSMATLSVSLFLIKSSFMLCPASFWYFFVFCGLYIVFFIFFFTLSSYLDSV